MSKDAVVRLRMTEQEKTAWEAAAEAAGLSISEWIRRRVNGTTTIEAPPAPSLAARRKRK